MPTACDECGVWVNRYEPVCTNCGTINRSYADDTITSVSPVRSQTPVTRPRGVEHAGPAIQSGGQLRFALRGIPVSVHWSFLVIALLGMGVYSGIEIAVWTLAVFGAVLLHESGHAFTARRFGARSVSIQLFAFGGATSWERATYMTPGQRFLATAAGSGVGLLAGAAVMVAVATSGFSQFDSLIGVAFDSFVWASLVWGGLNWLPILPLDGGQMVRAFLDAVTPRFAYQLTRALTVVVGGLVIWGLVQVRDWYLAFFAGLIILAGLRSPDTVTAVARPEGALEDDSGARVRSAIWMALALLVVLAVVYLAVTAMDLASIQA